MYICSILLNTLLASKERCVKHCGCYHIKQTTIDVKMGRIIGVKIEYIQDRILTHDLYFNTILDEPFFQKTSVIRKRTNNVYIWRITQQRVMHGIYLP